MAGQITSEIINTNQKGLCGMQTAMGDEYKTAFKKQQSEVRQMVMEGLQQLRDRNTKDFNDVCDRLENKYKIIGEKEVTAYGSSCKNGSVQCYVGNRE